MKKILLSVAALLVVSVSGQSFIQSYADRANQVQQANINTILNEFAALGVKTTGSTANNNAFNWLKNKYTAMGYAAASISEDAWTYGGNPTKNLIVTKTGTKYPDTFVIICGHYDTVVGPGVNDNGSGVSVILEIARILKDVPTEYSIKFINFSGEEQGLLGSQHYVNSVVNATNPKMKIKLVFNIDEVGGVAGMVNDTVFCDEDRSSPTANNAASTQATQELANCTTLYSPLKTDFDPAYASDYMPFQSNGEVITGFYEHNISQKPHTTGDILANMDPVYVFNVAKAAVGAAQHFAVAITSPVLSSVEISEKGKIAVFPNPAKDVLNLQLPDNNAQFLVEINDISGKLILKEHNKKQIDISKLSKGIYLVTVVSAGNKQTIKFIKN